MARPTLPINQNGSARIEGLKGSADAKKKIPLYPSVIKTGANLWSYDGLNNRSIFPSPRNTGWNDGWVAAETRKAMLLHPKIYQGVNLLKNAIVGDGGRWIPAVNPYGKDKSYFEEALKYTQFLEYCWRQCNGTNFSATRQLLNCITDGNKIAPISLSEQEVGRYKGKWTLDRLVPFPNGRYSFHHDEFGNFTTVKMNTGSGLQQEYPREKFFILSWRPIDGNPYGTTVLAPCYDPFYEDIQSQYELMAYMATFGRPSVIIFAAPPPEAATEVSKPLVYADGTPVMEPNPDYDPDEPISDINSPQQPRYGYQVEQNSLMFAEFKAGSVWSMEYGSLVQVVEARPGGDRLFNNVQEKVARRIISTILGSHQITENERNVSTSNAEVGEGVMGMNVTEGKVMLEIAEENDLAKVLIRLNFGDAALDLLPIRDYGSGQNGRIPKILNSVVGFINSGAWTQEMMWEFNASNGLPLNMPGGRPVIQRSAGIKPTKPGGADKSSQGAQPAQDATPPEK